MAGEGCNAREQDKQCVLSICMQDDMSEGSHALLVRGSTASDVC